MGFIILGILAANLIIKLIVGTVELAAYILTAIGLYEMAEKRNIDHAWFGWIPFLNMYLLGELINDKVFGIPEAKWILSLGQIVIGILAVFINPVGWIYTIISGLFYILTAWAYYELYRLYRPNLALIYFISGLIIPPLKGLWVFLCRKEAPQLRQY